MTRLLRDYNEIITAHVESMGSHIIWFSSSVTHKI